MTVRLCIYLAVLATWMVCFKVAYGFEPYAGTAHLDVACATVIEQSLSLMRLYIIEERCLKQFHDILQQKGNANLDIFPGTLNHPLHSQLLYRDDWELKPAQNVTKTRKKTVVMTLRADFKMYPPTGVTAFAAAVVFSANNSVQPRVSLGSCATLA